MSETAAAPTVKLRIENLSDLVFGLSLSIGSIILISKIPQTSMDLVSGIVLFGFSFLIVVWIWVGYTTTIAQLPAGLRGTFLLNVALLFCVALEPYLFYVLSQGPFELLDFASSLYAVDVGAMIFILGAIVRSLLAEERKRGAAGLPAARLERLRRLMLSDVAGGSMFAISALPFVWTPAPVGGFWRFDFWYASMALLFVVPRIRPKASRAEASLPSEAR